MNTAVIRFTRRVEGLDLANGNGTDVNRDQYTLRIDHQFNSKHKLSVIGTREKTWSGSGQAGQRAWPTGFDGLAVKRPDVYIDLIHVDFVPDAAQRIPRWTETVNRPSVRSREPS